jgi:LmbE family N-acetylglucosaminyl deacetylase
MGFFIPSKDRKPLFTLRIYKRHILAFVLVVAAAIIGYGIYFRAFMVLPQSSINILQELPISLANQKIMIVAPHCDDEVLGAGGLIEKALESGSEVQVAIMTNCNYQKNGATRKAETINALAGLGVKNDKITFLDFPEKDEKSKDNGGENEQVGNAFKNLFTASEPTLVILPHPDDTHIDHKTAGIEGTRALDDLGSSAQTIYYLIHYNFLKYPSPTGFHPDNYLTPPARLLTLSDQWYKFSLTSNEENLKEDAVLKYKSQLRRTNPIVHRILLDFIRRNELFMIREK